MKIRAQIGMVLQSGQVHRLHTCSVTCKTSGPAAGGGIRLVQQRGAARHCYPKEWENQDRWNGGWVRNPDGSIAPARAAK